MAKREYTEHYCVAQLTRLGCRFDAGKVFTVPRNKLGLKSLGMVAFLENYCHMKARYE